MGWKTVKFETNKNKIREIGPYQILLDVGDEQVMDFQEGDEGPFYLPDNHQINRKYDRKTGKCKIVTKTKKNIKRRIEDEGTLREGALQ